MDDRRTAVVTGAARGIGRAIVLELAREGYNLVGVDLDFENSDVGSQAEVRGIEFLSISEDIASLDGHDEILRQTYGRFGRMDCLVNNAGMAPVKRLDILETTVESYDRLMAVNARGTFFLSQKAARRMVEQPRTPAAPAPSIIFISSISAEVSSPSRAEYCLSKAVVSQAARLFADRLSEEGINVYEVRPGIIKTDMTAPVVQKYDRLIAEGLVPQKRWGFPEDVGRAVAALVRGDFGYATGLIVELSGGMNIRRL